MAQGVQFEPFKQSPHCQNQNSDFHLRPPMRKITESVVIKMSYTNKSVNKILKTMYKSLSDPYYQANSIYEYFNQNVPFIDHDPTLEEFGLPADAEEKVHAESKK